MLRVQFASVVQVEVDVEQLRDSVLDVLEFILARPEPPELPQVRLLPGGSLHGYEPR